MVTTLKRRQLRNIGVPALAAVLVTLGTSSVSVNAASPQLTDQAVAAGIDLGLTPSWDVCVGDYDGDGADDFHTSLHMKNAGALFHGNGDGTFTRVAYGPIDPLNVISPRPTPGFTAKSFVDRHACDWADVDGNGLQDLYSSAGRYASNRFKDEAINNELFLQIAPGVFKDFATQYGVGEPCTRGRHVVFEDFSRDGRPDLFLGAQVERADSTDPCNLEPDYPYNEKPKVFVNLGSDADGNWLGFRYGPEFDVGHANVGVRAALSWDENRDGLPDLLTLAHPSKAASLYRHTGSGFREVAKAKIVRLPVMNGAKIGDITGDSIDDLVYSDNSGFLYRRGTATGVSTTSVRLGTVPTGAIGWSIALGDVNGDGRLDVYGQVGVPSGGTGNPDDMLFVQRASSVSFQMHVVPSATGNANDVEAVHTNGRDSFVVLNGGNDESETAGPVQLISWQ